MQRGRRFLIFYFLLLGALSIVAVIPAGALIVLIFTGMALPLFGIPGLLVIASPTMLLYSGALVPLWLASIAPDRRVWRIAAAACIPIVVAIAPGMLSRHEAQEFAMRMSKDDASHPVAAKPRSIELAGDSQSGMFVYGQTIGDKDASCNEICRRLLFNGEVDWVRMTHVPGIYMNKRSGTASSATYHIEHRASCPELYPAGTRIEQAVRDRLIAGDCVIAESGDSAAAGATVTFTTSYFDQHYPPKPPEQGPRHAIIETVKDLRIESRQDGARTTVVRRTETVARTFALPFYIGSEMHMQGGYNGATLGRDETVVKPIDLAQAIRDAFGYKIAEISSPPAEDTRKIAERILALPPQANPVLSAQQQEALNDELTAIARQPTLADADVDLVRQVIADKRVTEARLGVVLQNMLRRDATHLESLIPVVLDRMSTPVPERVGHYQSSLGWSLTSFSAASLRPYRDKMVAIVEAQPDWVTYGVLTRLAELGDAAGVDLVIRALDSTSERQFAAIAACRASAAAWPALEAAVVAHLTPPRHTNNLQDDERPLLLALVRFDRKSLALDIVDKRGLFDKSGRLRRLASYEPGFAPEHCRDLL